MAKTKSIYPKYPRKAIVLLILYYLVPFFALSACCNLIYGITPHEYSKSMMAPSVSVYFVCYLLLATGGINSFVRNYNSYDGTEEKAHKIHRYLRFVGYSTIVFVLINSLVYSTLLCNAFDAYDFGRKCPSTSVKMIMVGMTLTWDMFFYLLWMTVNEKAMSHIKFTKKDVFMPVLLKNSIVAVMSTVAISLLSLAPLFDYEFQGMDLIDLFYSKCLGLTAFGIVFIFIDFFIMSKQVTDRVKEVVNYSQVLASGDYTQEPIQIVTRDDFAVLSTAMNKFVSESKVLLSGMNSTVGTSTDAAGQSSSSMQEISATVSQIVNNIEEVQTKMQSQSSSVMEAASTMNEILGNIRGLNNTIDSQSSAVQESSSAVREMVTNIQNVTQILEKNEISTRELEAASEEGQQKIIESVRLSEKIMAESTGLMEASRVIQNIAEQTNLLAMNAAIEAAHAGETGKGFSVVADEIRKLAEQSNVQGKKITESLQGLETVIEGVSESTSQLEKQFKIIYDLTKIVKEQESVVMNTMKEQAEGSTQVLEAMKQIDDSTLNVRHGSNEMMEGSTQIANEMNNLGDSTTLMSDRVSQMSSGAQQIINAVERGSSAVDLNLQSIQHLEDEMKKFKL